MNFFIKDDYFFFEGEILGYFIFGWVEIFRIDRIGVEIFGVTFILGSKRRFRWDEIFVS